MTSNTVYGARDLRMRDMTARSIFRGLYGDAPKFTPACVLQERSVRPSVVLRDTLWRPPKELLEAAERERSKRNWSWSSLAPCQNYSELES